VPEAAFVSGGPAEVAPLGVEEGAACAIVPRGSGDGEEVVPLDGEFVEIGPMGGVLTGGVFTGSEGVLTCGVVNCGVVRGGVVIGPAVIVGAVAVGVVSDGTVSDGTVTGGSGDDAAAGAAGTTSAPTMARTASTTRAEASPLATTRDPLPHGLFTDDGADIAHRSRSRPLSLTGISGRLSLHPRRRLNPPADVTACASGLPDQRPGPSLPPIEHGPIGAPSAITAAGDVHCLVAGLRHPAHRQGENAEEHPKSDCRQNDYA